MSAENEENGNEIEISVKGKLCGGDEIELIRRTKNLKFGIEQANDMVKDVGLSINFDTRKGGG